MNFFKKIFLLFSLLLFFVSCEEQTYCAQCYEENSGYQADDYCGSIRMLIVM